MMMDLGFQEGGHSRINKPINQTRQSTNIIIKSESPRLYYAKLGLQGVSYNEYVW
jgi:hypothetical protein